MKVEETPLYRLFNVLIFLGYAFVFLLIPLAAYFAYQGREMESATIVCKDGTSWNALEPVNILYDSPAKCGLCTQRDPVTAAYTNCSYGNIDYNSFDTEITKVDWTWNVVIHPLIVMAIGLGAIDFLRIAVIYIFSGAIALDKSLLLRLILLFVKDQ